MSVQYNIDQLKTFMEKYEGKLVTDQFGLYKGECVSLVKQWLRWNKWPMLWGNAIMWQYRGDGKNYRFYKNTKTFVPNPGDMAIFEIKNSVYGHIGIVISGTTKSMKVFNQNWPKGKNTDVAQVTTFNYVDPKCIGFLRKL